MILVVGLSIVARKIKILFPVLLTVAGLLLGFIPSFPRLFLDPSIVLLVFLPPILYSAAWYTNWYDFKININPIFILAFTMVIVTTIGIGFLAKAFLPGFSLAMGFLLGAIISPPDAVAATSVFKKVSIPKRIITILQGESLVNDASALIAFQFALTAVSTGYFSMASAAGQFFIVVIGGIAIGLLVGVISLFVHRKWKMEPAIEIGVTFITAYAAYLAADKFHFSGVLSVVTAGIYVGNRQAQAQGASLRLQAVIVWNFVVILLEGVIFLLIGLQIPYIIEGIKDEPLKHLLLEGLLISLSAILIRFIFIYGVSLLSNIVRKRLKLKPLFSSGKHIFIIAYAGMRGVVSLAAAFSIPLVMMDGSTFPERNHILFLVFCVIVFTLVIQGITFPWLIKKLRFAKALNENERINSIQQNLNEAALKQVKSVIKEEKLNNVVAEKIRDIYQQRVNDYMTCKTPEELRQKQLSKRLLLEAVRAKRKKLIELQAIQHIDYDLFHALLNEVDLEETRLENLRIR